MNVLLGVAVERFVARGDDLLVEEIDSGLVIYDKRSDRAHWLDASAAAVWRACEEPRTEADIARAAGIDTTTCDIVLSHLAERGLLENESGLVYSRRTVLRSAAKVGLAGAMAAPIVSAVIPVAAAHASVIGGGGGGGGGGGTQHTYTVQSGNENQGAPPGSPDPTNSVFDSQTGQLSPPFPLGAPAFNVVPNGAWFPPLGSSNWIGPEPNSGFDFDPPDYFYYTYLPGLPIPPGATGATISGSFGADNVGAVFVNNVRVPVSDAGFGSPVAFTASLNPGQNSLAFEVLNGGGPTGLDFFATVSYTM